MQYCISFYIMLDLDYRDHWWEFWKPKRVWTRLILPYEGEARFKFGEMRSEPPSHLYGTQLEELIAASPYIPTSDRVQ